MAEFVFDFCDVVVWFWYFVDRSKVSDHSVLFVSCLIAHLKGLRETRVVKGGSLTVLNGLLHVVMVVRVVGCSYSLLIAATLLAHLEKGIIPN